MEDINTIEIIKALKFINKSRTKIANIFDTDERKIQFEIYNNDNCLGVKIINKGEKQDTTITIEDGKVINWLNMTSKNVLDKLESKLVKSIKPTKLI